LAQALLDLHRARAVALSVLDLTAYEAGNALIRGMGVPAAQSRIVLEALDVICPRLAATPLELDEALVLAERHNLTVYDAAYAAVAQGRNALLATMDRSLLAAGLGSRPSEIVGALR